MPITLPHNGWRPRPDQLKLWSYLENGGKRAVEIAHRRWGKDDVILHWTAIAANDVGSKQSIGRVGSYWHLLPQANQVRKAIWEAVNPRTGLRRIDEAFPREIIADRRETDMFIRFKSGSTWQALGSDSFNAHVGAAPVGVALSEWALSNPFSWAYLRPILDENKGWAAFITTPRGRNHAHATLELAQKTPGWFWEVLRADQTPVFTREQLRAIEAEFVSEYGADDGASLFAQEYMCSFNASLVGSYYAKIIEQLESSGRIMEDMDFDPDYPVETAWDLGYSDDTTVWFFQVVGGEPRVLACYSNHGFDIGHYAEYVSNKAKERGWWYYKKDPREALHHVPWDARPKTLASGGKSLLEIAWNDYQLQLRVAPNLSVQDGIQATRKFLARAWFDKSECSDGIEALRNYKREWDDERKVFSIHPEHDWTSHYADGCRIMSIVSAQRISANPKPLIKPPVKDFRSQTFDELVKRATQRSFEPERI